MSTAGTLLAIEPFTHHHAFTLWRLAENPAGPTHKPVKVPVHYDGSTRHSLGRPARRDRPAVAPNPAPPMSAEQAAGWLSHHLATGVGHDRRGEVGYLGVGFRPEGTGLVCVDLDDCVVDGTWAPGAQPLFARFPGALIESSVSGKGAHIWFTASGVGRRPKQVTPLGDVEVYGAGQFIACGTVLSGDASVDHTAAVHALIAEFWPDAPAAKGASVEWGQVPQEEQGRVIEELRSALPFCSQSTYADWTARGMALVTLGDDVGLPLWHELSALHEDYDEEAVEAKWFQLTPTRTGYAAIFTHAEANGWVNPRRRQALPADAGAVFAGPLLATPPAGMLLEPPASRQAELSFIDAAGGAIAATVEKVSAALMNPANSVRISHDKFTDQTSIAIGNEARRPIRTADYGRLRALFERCGSKPVPAEIMKTAVGMAADENQHDSAIGWAESIVWDGAPRIDAALARYYGCDATPYASAVGAYLFTALAGRALVPGIKADMALVLVGLQGAGKTSAVEALCPIPGAFGEINLKSSDDALARQIRGKLVVELAELNGLGARDQEALKAWLSRRVDEHRPLYENHFISYGRRCIVIGTGNAPRFLDDETGARRWLPLEVGTVDVEALRADVTQLWAEGVTRFRQSGIAWQDAERLARAEHSRFQLVDERQALVEAWLQGCDLGVPVPRCDRPIRSVDVAIGALNFLPSQFTGAAQKQIAKIMKHLGYSTTKQRVDGRPQNLWVRTGI